MKISKYNIEQEIEHEQMLLYNTLTTSLVVLDKAEFESIFIERNFAHPEAGELLVMGFLVEDEFDEIGYLRELRENVVKANTTIADVMLAPTMDCNARCYYCFEHGCHHDKMTKETADAVVKYLIRYWNGSLLNITWFGGEPLLAPDIIDYITERLLAKNIKLISKITTNGLLLTREAALKALNRWHTTKIQISMDAYGEEYNRIKNYADRSVDNPFAVVQENLHQALALGLKVKVRINFNPDRQETAIDLMNHLQTRFGAYERFSAYFASIDAASNLVRPIAGEFPDRATHPYRELINVSRNYGYYKGNGRGAKGNFLYDEKGLLNSLKLYPSPTNCYASSPCVFAIDSRGDLYKCHRVLGKGDQYSSGNVQTGVIQNEIFQFFANPDYSLRECEDCKLLPICQGGCKINAYLYHDEHACIPTKAIIKDLILDYARGLAYL